MIAIINLEPWIRHPLPVSQSIPLLCFLDWSPWYYYDSYPDHQSYFLSCDWQNEWPIRKAVKKVHSSTCNVIRWLQFIYRTKKVVERRSCTAIQLLSSRVMDNIFGFIAQKDMSAMVKWKQHPGQKQPHYTANRTMFLWLSVSDWQTLIHKYPFHISISFYCIFNLGIFSPSPPLEGVCVISVASCTIVHKKRNHNPVIYFFGLLMME